MVPVHLKRIVIWQIIKFTLYVLQIQKASKPTVALMNLIVARTFGRMIIWQILPKLRNALVARVKFYLINMKRNFLIRKKTYNGSAFVLHLDYEH